MGAHWTDRRAAKAAIARFLMDKGWDVHGYKEDRSDSMTDYYDPPSWDGVAEKDGLVLVVDRFDNRQSGGETRYKNIPYGTCKRCGGNGADPLGWTLEQARANPREYHKARSKIPGQGISLMPDVVSPIPFLGRANWIESDNVPRELYGRMRCVSCGGKGNASYRQEEYIIPWPEFQANPDGSLWHVERNGKILDKGRALYIMDLSRMRYGSEDEKADGRAKLERLYKRWSKYLTEEPPKDKEPPQEETNGMPENTAYSVEYDRDWTWIAFPAKPPALVRENLKKLGARWSKRRQAWYIRERVDFLTVGLAIG